MRNLCGVALSCESPVGLTQKRAAHPMLAQRFQPESQPLLTILLPLTVSAVTIARTQVNRGLRHSWFTLMVLAHVSEFHRRGFQFTHFATRN